MKSDQATKWVQDDRAACGRVVLDRERKEIVVHDDAPKGGELVSHRIKIAAASDDNYKDLNSIAAHDTHTLTDGGRGRYVDAVIRRLWVELSLPDRSVEIGHP